MLNIFEEAVAFAFEKHKNQMRKDGSAFILHPLEVATIVGTMTNDLEVLAAAVLHDTVEDTNTTLNEIVDKFGPRVAKLVAYETENKFSQISKNSSWKMRKEESIQKLKSVDDISVKMIYLGDKLSNMRSIAGSFNTNGYDLFNNFHMKNPKEHYWYYSSILDSISELQNFYAYIEYKELINYVFNEYRKEHDVEKSIKIR